MLDGETSSAELRSFADALASSRELRSVYEGQMEIVSMLMRRGSIGTKRRRYRGIAVAASLMAVFALAFANLHNKQETPKRESVMKTPLALAAASLVAAQSGEYQFIRRGDPEAAATESAFTVASKGIDLETGTLSSQSKEIALDSMVRTVAVSKSCDLNTTKFKGTIVVLI